MCFTGRSVDEIRELLLFTVTDGGHFEFYALENSACLFKRCVGAYFFYKYRTTVTTLLAEGWSRNHGFGPYYRYGYGLLKTLLFCTSKTVLQDSIVWSILTDILPYIFDASP